MKLAGVVLVAFLAVLGPAPPGLASSLYVTNTKSNSLSIIDTNTLEVVGTIPLGAVAIRLPVDALLDDLVLVIIEVVAQIEQQLAGRERLAGGRGWALRRATAALRASINRGRRSPNIAM